MATEKQIAANRRNAQKSTGPKTEEGRRVTRLNAYKHGLTGQLLVMTDEQAEVRENFLDSVVDDLKPVGVMERLLAQSIAEAYWRMNRAAAMENNIFAHEAWIEETRVTQNSPESAYKYDDIDRAFASVRSFVQNPERFQLLAVYEMRFHRKAQADLKQLRELQATRLASEQKAAQEKVRQDQGQQQSAAAQTPDLSTIQPQNGFVFSTGPEAPPVVVSEPTGAPHGYVPAPAEPTPPNSYSC